MKRIKIKEYDSVINAHMDRTLLESYGIHAEIINEYTSTMIPALRLTEPTALVVAEEDVEQALKIVGIP